MNCLNITNIEQGRADKLWNIRPGNAPDNVAAIETGRRTA